MVISEHRRPGSPRFLPLLEFGRPQAETRDVPLMQAALPRPPDRGQEALLHELFKPPLKRALGQADFRSLKQGAHRHAERKPLDRPQDGIEFVLNGVFWYECGAIF